MNFGTITKFLKSPLKVDEEVAASAPAPRNREDKEAQMFQKYGQKNVLLEWVSAGKLQIKQYNPKFIRLGLTIILVVGLVLALMQDFVLIILIGSVIFFYIVLSEKYAGSDVPCQITNYGVAYGKGFYYWDSIRYFFFSKRISQDLLIIDLKDDIVPRLLITFPDDKKDEIDRILKEYILYLDKEPKNIFDKYFGMAVDKLNLQDTGFEDKK